MTPETLEIVSAIEGRIAAARAEMDSLKAARAAMAASPRADSRPNGRATASRVAGRPGQSKSPARRHSRRRSPELPAEVFEQLLADFTDGISATALARQTGAPYATVTGRLRDLERAGRVTRSGARRTSRWRLISDEERIAVRVAELERARASSA